jgi:hypothetical protein
MRSGQARLVRDEACCLFREQLGDLRDVRLGKHTRWSAGRDAEYGLSLTLLRAGGGPRCLRRTPLWRS